MISVSCGIMVAEMRMDIETHEVEVERQDPRRAARGRDRSNRALVSNCALQRHLPAVWIAPSLVMMATAGCGRSLAAQM